MKSLIIILTLLFSLPAYADDVTCADRAETLADLENQKASPEMDGETKLKWKEKLDIVYKRYYDNGCTEAELKKHFTGNIKPRTKEESK